MAEVKSENDALAITLTEPEPGGPRELRGELRFVEGGAARSAEVALALFAQAGVEEMTQGALDAETRIAGGAAKIDRGTEPTRFTIELPPAAARYAGRSFHIGVGVVVTPDAGRPLRVLVDVPPAPDARLLLRGLPKEEPLARPARFFLGLAVAAISATLVVPVASSPLAVGPLLGIVVGAIFLLASRRGMLGWLRLGAGAARLEAREVDGRRELVAVVRAPRATGGKLRLVAVEQEVHRGQPVDHGEIVASEGPLSRGEGGALTGRVPLPAAAAAPPSLALRAPRRLLSIRWLARLEIEAGGGAPARFEIPVHVGVEATSTK